jgi:NAD(P)-dependent dehydrogenase (short-subunit alcohol dehydrogenase family)
MKVTAAPLDNPCEVSKDTYVLTAPGRGRLRGSLTLLAAAPYTHPTFSLHSAPKVNPLTTDLLDKVALVTGGTSGIGRDTAVLFAQAGAKVVVAGRRELEGKETVDLIRAAGGEGLFVKADVAKTADVQAMVQKTVEKFGRLDVAFNNAGIEGIWVPIVEQSEEDFDRVIDINVKGVWLCLKYELQQMLKQGTGGAIVNMSSVAGLMGAAAAATYVASKHAVIGLTRSAALETALKGIRVNAVCPAVIETAMAERAFGDPAANKAVLAHHPIGRFGKPLEIAEAVLWMCSSKASFMTGHYLVLDGGFLAGPNPNA